MKELKTELKTIDLSGNNAAERQQWDAFVENTFGGHLMQTCAWGDFKAAEGWMVHRLGVEQNGRLAAGAQVLFKALPLAGVSLAYIPKGPALDFHNRALAEQLLTAIHQLSRQKRAIFLKIEPNILHNAQSHRWLQNAGFRPGNIVNHPRATLLVDLSGGQEAVLRRMRKKTRKLIRRARREGVEITKGQAQDLSDFYRLYKFTAAKKGFAAHRQQFFENAWQAFAPTGRAALLLARYQQQIVAAKMIFTFGDRSMHFWGGTSDLGRQKFASYLIQWAAIQRAIERGCRYADLWGIPDEIGEMIANGEEIPKNRQGDLWGVYNFKRGFGADIEYYLGAYDYVYIRFPYWLITNFLYPVSERAALLLEKLNA